MDQPDPLDLLADRAGVRSRSALARALAVCDQELAALGLTLARRVVPVTTAFLRADEERAHGHAAGGDLDRRCVSLEERCLALMARQAPVARDLRHVVAVVRSVGDVRRSAALLRHVAESLSWVDPSSLPPALRDLVADLGEATASILDGAAAAWAARDALAANELARRDDVVDGLQRELLRALHAEAPSVDDAVSLALVARHYERIADHAVEMARNLAYYRTGARVGNPED